MPEILSENEWNLKRENLQLRQQLAIAESRICQFVAAQCNAEMNAMGDKWEPKAADVTPIRAAD